MRGQGGLGVMRLHAVNRHLHATARNALRGAEVMTKPGTMMQEVAADQAIMQLMDARGTLLELKVTTWPTCMYTSSVYSRTKPLWQLQCVV